jgi:hypothetical protein
MTISNDLYVRDAALDSDLDDEINALAAELGMCADDDRDHLITIIEEQEAL